MLPMRCSEFNISFIIAFAKYWRGEGASSNERVNTERPPDPGQKSSKNTGFLSALRNALKTTT
eukprot:6462802-Amphidinium_carterae.2